MATSRTAAAFALASLTSGACGSPERRGGATPMTADLASAPPEAHAVVTAPDTATTTRLRTLRVTEQPLPRGLDGDWGPAPCDFARLYRGRVGEASVSVLLRRPDERSSTP